MFPSSEYWSIRKIQWRSRAALTLSVTSHFESLPIRVSLFRRAIDSGSPCLSTPFRQQNLRKKNWIRSESEVTRIDIEHGFVETRTRDIVIWLHLPAFMTSSRAMVQMVAPRHFLCLVKLRQIDRRGPGVNLAAWTLMYVCTTWILRVFPYFYHCITLLVFSCLFCFCFLKNLMIVYVCFLVYTVCTKWCMYKVSILGVFQYFLSLYRCVSISRASCLFRFCFLIKVLGCCAFCVFCLESMWPVQAHWLKCKLVTR